MYCCTVLPFVFDIQLPGNLASVMVFVDAPVVYLPLKEILEQALVINCDCLKMQNSYSKLDSEVKRESSVEKRMAYVSKYDFKLTRLQIAR